MKLLLTGSICLLLLLGCTRRVHVAQPGTNWDGPFYSTDHTYAYYTNGHGNFIVISKTGPQKAQRELCPKDSACTLDNMGQMYSLDVYKKEH